jgi:polar amino acid transport system permease protein/polar amino acid transport system substrate-binding protein
MDFIYENLIAGGAYKFFLSGLGITVLITAMGLLIGTAVGVCLCALSRSRFRVLRGIFRGYMIVMGGTPALLVLMLFYYVLFAPLRINALSTAFIAFGLKVGADIGEIMKSALSAVDRGQIQAARTLGFTAAGAFFHITLPQAARFGRPLYKNAAISLLQYTSITGYITVTELTRVVNSVQARTGQPFASMAVGIVLYLLLAALMNGFFRLADIRGGTSSSGAGERFRQKKVRE